MKRKIRLKELHSMASQMKYHDFENWVAEQIYNQPYTVDTKDITDKLFLSDVSRSELLIGFLIELNDKGLINNHDFDYQNEASKYAKKNN